MKVLVRTNNFRTENFAWGLPLFCEYKNLQGPGEWARGICEEDFRFLSSSSLVKYLNVKHTWTNVKKMKFRAFKLYRLREDCGFSAQCFVHYSHSI